MHMRRLLTFAGLVLLSGSTALAQGEPPKPDTTKKAAATHVGNWRGAATTDQGAQEVWASIKKDGDKYIGMTGSQMGETAMYDVKVSGDTLSAGATMSTPNGNFDLWYSLLLKGDTLVGTIDLNIQGQKLSIPVSFKREP
jgi:hypothetical protein